MFGIFQDGNGVIIRPKKENAEAVISAAKPSPVAGNTPSGPPPETVTLDEARKLMSGYHKFLEGKGREIPTHSWFYTDFEGRVYQVVMRFNASEPGEKTFLQFRIKNGKLDASGIEPFYRLPYKYHELIATDGPVLIVEGEKACEAANKYLPDINWSVTTWAGGSAVPNRLS